MLAALLFAAPALAGEETIVLKDGLGKDLVEANCATCHSLDYIEMNSPFLDQKKWEATVAKMVDRFGAPVSAADVPAIVSYLTANYGP
jgi:mono/diheme cytochrome c family protein